MEQIFLLLFQNAVKCTTLILIYLMSVMLFLSKKNVLTDQMLDLLKVSLNAPLAEDGSFHSETFSVEKKNLITELEAEIENHYYYAHQQLNRLFYDQADMKLSKYGSVQQIQNEDEGSAYQAFQEMLQTNLIDFFFYG